MATISRLLLSRFAVPLTGLLSLAAAIVIYLHFPGLWWSIKKMLVFGTPPEPFGDWRMVPAAAKCWSEGVNVYIDNTCTETGRLLGFNFNYSPLWLRMPFLQHAEQWVNETMLAVIVLFFLSLATLPPPRGPRAQMIALLATLSSSTFLAFERGNADLIMFVLVVLAVNLGLLALPFRLVSYTVFTLIGLLKFYPFVALFVALRERVSVLIAVAIASVAAFALLILTFHQELGLMAKGLPKPSYVYLQFGSANLPVALGVSATNILRTMLHYDTAEARVAGALVARGAFPLLIVTALVAAVAVGRMSDLPNTLERLSARQTSYLVVGAALICGCFFAMNSVVYRGVYLLLVLPGLSGLSDQVPAPLGRRLFGAACFAIPFVLWKPFFDMCLALANHWAGAPAQFADPYEIFPGLSMGFVLWLSVELAWWWLIILFLAILGSFALRSDAWALVSRWYQRHPVLSRAR
jgi:hypothetical protein